MREAVLRRAGGVSSPGRMSGSAEDTGKGARWLDRLAGLALLTSVATVAGAGTPAVLRVVGVGGAPEGYGELPRPRPPASAPTSTAPPRRFDFVFDDDAPERGSPTASPPGRPASPAWDSPRVGRVRTKLELRDEAASGGGVVGELAPGVVVVVVKEQGEWLLVAQTGTDGMAFGWVPRSGVAIR